MLTALTVILASTPPAAVPDTGSSGLILGLALLSLGVAARVIKNRKR